MTLKDKVNDKIEEMRAMKKMKNMAQGMSLNTIFDVYSKQLIEAKKKLSKNEIALEKAREEGNTKEIEKMEKNIAEQKKWLDFVENKIGIDGRIAKKAGGFKVEEDKSNKKLEKE
jgi:hypothetical protein